MANPRQRRKARSSTHRPVSHSRNAQRNLKKQPPIRGPKVLQEAWDRHKTVRQNYASVGLAHNMNPSASGGAEHTEHSIIVDETVPPAAPIPSSSTNIPEASKKSFIPKGHGRIIRDESGNVVGVELAEEDEDQEPSDENMETLIPEISDAVRGKWINALGGEQNENRSDGSLVKSLERISATVDPLKNTISASLSGVGPRHASEGEVRYLQRLVDKYGLGVGGVEKMTRDRKLNSEQRTSAQLVKALKRAGLM